MIIDRLFAAHIAAGRVRHAPRPRFRCWGSLHCKLSLLVFTITYIHGRIVRIQFRSGRRNGKLPVDADARRQHRQDGGADLRNGGNAPMQARTSECGELTFDHVEPTRRFRREMNAKRWAKATASAARRFS